MRSFTAQVPDLQTTGPIVHMRVWVDPSAEESMTRRGDGVPAPVEVKGLIDTGASTSVIQPFVVRELGLQPVGVVSIHTPSSRGVRCFQYLVRFVFPNGVAAEVLAVEAPLEGQAIQCLIGRDVLAGGVLIYTGYMNQFTLSF